VVTGLGAITPLGNDVPTFWSRALAGECGVGPIRRFDASSYPTRIAAESDDSGLEDDGNGPDRILRFAMAATGQAITDSRISQHLTSPSRVGVLLASGMGSYDHEEVFASTAGSADASGEMDWSRFHRLLARNLAPHSPRRRTPGSVPAAVAMRHGFRGPVMSVMTACAAGTQAIGDAARWIRMGDADAVVCGGSDSEIYPMGLASFCLLGALSRRNDAPHSASRPFDAGRDGFVIGEGAGALVLEEMGHAVRRGAYIYAELVGFGSACDSYRVTDPHPDGRGAVLAMQRALRGIEGGIEEIGYINAHGTSTVANDKIETTSIKRLFGERARSVAVSSTKSMIGHLTVAAGAVEAIATILTLRDQKIHPTINYEKADSECDLDYVPWQAREKSLSCAMSNSFAFGGQCASVVFRRVDA
jgi:3-oxoacyl-[acyl-carrier-protein] synthase II